MADPYGSLTFQPGVDWQHENPGFLSALDQAARAAGVVFDVFSGYRSPAYSVSVGGYSDDPHTRGVAADVSVAGRPAGQVVPQQTFARFGLESGNQPNFYRGQPDPSHIQVVGAGADKTIGAARVATNVDTKAGIQEIVARSRATNVDALAALSVASTEGLAGGIGDGGTSFGPFQLHQGGGYPASAPQDQAGAQQWAWSKEGIDYAVDHIAGVSANLRGYPAVAAIVTRFERPANPAAEVSAAWGKYQQSGGDSASRLIQGGSGGVGGGLSLGDVLKKVSVGGSPIDQAVDTTRAVESKVGGVGDALSFLLSVRFLEILGGMALVGIGIVGLVKNEAVSVVLGNTAGGLAAGSAGRGLQREAERRPSPSPPKRRPDAGTSGDRPRPSAGGTRGSAMGRTQATGDDIPF
jgi:hypothetical protein